MDREIRVVIGVPKKQAAGTAQFCRRFVAELSGDARSNGGRKGCG
jgi:hypothetical protein